MKRCITFFTMVCLVTTTSYSQAVSKDDATVAAKNWIVYCEKEGTHSISASTHLLAEDGSTLAHCFELLPYGFIITSSWQELPPVIAYSFTGSQKLPDNDKNPLEEVLIYDLKTRVDHIAEIPEQEKILNRSYWNDLFSGIYERLSFEQWPPAGSTSTGGWLETNWKQSAPYNVFCPMDQINNARSLAGCPAVALAMIIHYQKELNGTRFDDGDDYYHSYAGRQYWIDDDSHGMDFPPFPTLNAYFDSITAKFPDYIPLSTDEIAALIFACGIAAQQVYTSEVSGTFGVDQAYDAYMRFGYSDAVLLYDTDTSFYTHMKTNMKDGIPVHLALLVNGAGGGHNVVADGYNTDDFYHLNFGWGGSYNGWYLIPEGIPYNLTIVEGAIMDIGISHVGIRSREVNTDLHLKVYPNPASGELKISFELEQAAIVRVLICDLKGSIVEIMAEEHFEKGEHLFMKSTSIPPGNYFVVLEANNDIQTQKLLIQN